MPEPKAEIDLVDVQERRVTALIELARTSLADARTATLLIEGVGRVGSDTASAITLCERAGCPVLLCPAWGVLAEVAGDGCAAVLSVPSAARRGSDGAVIFLGRLQKTGTYGSGDERTAILELAPASIVIEAPATEVGDDLGLQHVDLPRYSAHCHRASHRTLEGRD